MKSPTPLDIRTSLARLAAPSLGLLMFAAMILRGLYAGNPPRTILVRALWGLAAGVVLGSFAGGVANRVICDGPTATNEPVVPGNDVAASQA